LSDIAVSDVLLSDIAVSDLSDIAVSDDVCTQHMQDVCHTLAKSKKEAKKIEKKKIREVIS